MKKRTFLVCITTTMLLLSRIDAISAVHAQTQFGNITAERYLSRIGFTLPVGEGSPSRTQSGASRNLQCSSIIPLLPEGSTGLTTEEQLALYLYVPDDSVKQAVLSVKKADDSELYDTIVDLPVSGGVVAVALPEALPALETGESYNWSLVLMCNGQLRPDSPIISGAVKRVEPVLTPDQSQTLSLPEKAALYGDSGLWYDLISTLVQIRSENPGDAQWSEDWAYVLTTVGLEEIVDEPLVSP